MRRNAALSSCSIACLVLCAGIALAQAPPPVSPDPNAPQPGVSPLPSPPTPQPSPPVSPPPPPPSPPPFIPPPPPSPPIIPPPTPSPPIIPPPTPSPPVIIPPPTPSPPVARPSPSPTIFAPAPPTAPAGARTIQPTASPAAIKTALSVRFTQLRTQMSAIYNWAVQAFVNPSSISFPVNGQGTADYSVQVTRTASNGNFAVSGTFRVTSLQLFPLVFFGARVQTRQLGNPSTGPRFFTAPATCTNTLFGNLVIVYPLDGFFFAPTDCRFTQNLPTGNAGDVMPELQVVSGNPLLPANWIQAPLTNGQPAPFNFQNAQIVNEVAPCALVFDSFLSGPGRLTPTSFPRGSPIGASNAAQRVCRSQTFSFRAAYGPLDQNNRRKLAAVEDGVAALPAGAGGARALQQIGVCGNYRSDYRVTVDPQGSNQGSVSDSTTLAINVFGCVTNPTPAVTIQSLSLRQARAWVWSVTKTSSVASVNAAINTVVPVGYTVNYIRTPSGDSAYVVTVNVAIQNRFNIPMIVDSASVTVARSTFSPYSVDAECPTDINGRIVVNPNSVLVCPATFTLDDDTNTNIQARVQAYGSATPSPVTTIDFSRASVVETGRCAAISDSFFQTAPPTYAVPFSVTGTKAPNQGSELTICQSTTYKYTANFRFNNKECGTKLSYNAAAAQPQGSTQPQVLQPRNVRFVVSGCPVPPRPLPTVALGPVITANITGNYTWAFARQVIPAANAVSVPFDQASQVVIETVYKRSATPVKIPTAYLARGWVTLANPTTAPLAVGYVTIQLSRGTRTPIFTNATCPGARPNGAVTLPPRGAPALNCTWSTAYPDSKPSLASAVVHMPDGVKLGSNLQAFNFMKAPNTAAGACATISDVWTYVSENGVAQSPAVFGAKVPARPTTLCASRTYRAVAQFGPYADDACGADRFTSLSSFQPTGGFFTQRRSTVGLSVFVVDCPLASGQGVFEVPQDVAVVALPAAPAP